MAKQTAAGSIRQEKPKVKRKFVGAKSKTSSTKTSKNYKKKYVGQG